MGERNYNDTLYIIHFYAPRWGSHYYVVSLILLSYVLIEVCKPPKTTAVSCLHATETIAKSNHI